MRVDILCSGCDDCELIKGKVCQALADLNLKVDVVSNHDPRKHTTAIDCDGQVKMLIDGLLVSARNDCSVRDLMLLFDKEAQMDT